MGRLFYSVDHKVYVEFTAESLFIFFRMKSTPFYIIFGLGVILSIVSGSNFIFNGFHVVTVVTGSLMIGIGIFCLIVPFSAKKIVAEFNNKKILYSNCIIGMNFFSKEIKNVLSEGFGIERNIHMSGDNKMGYQQTLYYDSGNKVTLLILREAKGKGVVTAPLVKKILIGYLESGEVNLNNVVLSKRC